MKKIGLLYLSVFVLLCFSNITWGQIAAWDFTGVGTTSLPTYAATTFNSNLVSSSSLNLITRGSTAAWSTAGNSFRTVGFKNEGISTSNTDYFQITLQANTGYTLSLSTINAKFGGTATFYATPGVTSQFAYSLNGTTFTLIGSPVQSTSLTMGQVNLAGVSALQSVAAGTTVTLRYYASGQTTSGGWGFLSAATAGTNGLAIGGTVTLAGVTPPTVTTTAVTGITSIAASSGGNVTDQGSASVTARGVVWSTSASPTVPSANSTLDGSGSGSFTSSITGLTMGTLYHVRAYATSTAGTSYGADVQFTTLGPPTLTTTSASSITMSAASSGGNITSDGGDPVTARGVVWSTSTTPTLPSVNSTSDGSGIGTFTSSISGLIDNTLYYVRAYAINTYGTAYGSQQTFTTSAIGAPNAIAATNYSDNGFRANWNSVPGAVSYKLDVATSSNFGTTILISEGFAGGFASPPSGWTFTTITSQYTSAGNYGAASPSISFAVNGASVMTPTFSASALNSLSFWIKGQSTNASSALLVEESSNGTSWTTVANITPLPTTATTETYSLLSTTIQVRFTYTKSAGNLSFDDVLISQNDPSQILAGYNNLTVSGTFQDVTGLSTFSQYYYRVRAVGGNSTSLNSETITVNNPLPVELSSFTSKVDGRNVNLNWETKTEKNSDKFVIEKQTISASWESIGSVKAAVLSNSTKQYSFSDKNLNTGVYQYRLKMIDNDGSFKYSSLTEAAVSSPKNFELLQNYPNPFNPSTKINYNLPSDSRVTLEVFNVLGMRVGQLVNKDQSAGFYSVDFNSSLNKNITSGVYLYKITAVDKVTGNSFSAIKKMMMLK
jgi:hypothetical protein